MIKKIKTYFYLTYTIQTQNVAEKPESEATDPRTKSVSDTARDLATLHHICVSHLKELQVLSKTQVCF